jgi:hypothetical protein
MAIISEVGVALATVANSIGHIREISEAIREGRDYLKVTHPEVKDDLIMMCAEMQKSASALATASSIVTHFRFVIGDSLPGEASRFNEHLMANKSQAETLEQQIASMRGHCLVIKEHAETVKKKAGGGMRSLAAAFGLHSVERERELADALEGIYDEEMQYHQGVNMMARAVRRTLEAVQEALGPPGVIDPGNVPAAAAVLGEYATAFAELESACNYNALQLQQSIDALRLP